MLQFIGYRSFWFSSNEGLCGGDSHTLSRRNPLIIDKVRAKLRFYSARQESPTKNPSKTLIPVLVPNSHKDLFPAIVSMNGEEGDSSDLPSSGTADGYEARVVEKTRFRFGL